MYLHNNNNNKKKEKKRKTYEFDYWALNPSHRYC